MRSSEFIVTVGFGLAVAAVFAAGAALAIRALWRRKGGGLSRRARILERVTWSACGAGLLCIGYSFLEPRRLVVEHEVVASERVQSGRAVRIVHISDLHSDGAPGLEPRLPDIVRRAKPQVIVFTGDASNEYAGLEVFRSCMRELSEIAPTFGVRGNWDARLLPNDVFTDTGVRELCGESVTLDVGGMKLWIGGAPAWESWWAGQLAPTAPPEALKLFLYHSPDGIRAAAEAGMDVCLVGHTHGGQVRLPFYGALITLSNVGKKYESGPYRVGRMWAYVNRGVGMEGHGAPRIRFLCPPEVTVIDLVSARDAARQ